MDNGILSGLRVIDCGTYVAGPASTTIMSDFGAEVLKIERPQGGDLYRSMSDLPGFAKADLNWGWILTSRNKKSVALDLASPQGREALIRLVKTADVFVSNYQHPLLEKFRLTWADLQPENDRLIYAHLSGYGDAGEDADAPTFDALAYWARSGLMMSVVGMDGTPGGPRPGMGDHPTSVSLFSAIMLGLYQRERTGRGLKVGTSLLASGAWANACDLQAKFCNATFPERGDDGTPPNPLAAGYRSRDGKAFLAILLDPDKEFPNLCKALGQAELATNRCLPPTKPGGRMRRPSLPFYRASLNCGTLMSGGRCSNSPTSNGRPCRYETKWSKTHRCGPPAPLWTWSTLGMAG